MDADKLAVLESALLESIELDFIGTRKVAVHEFHMAPHQSLKIESTELRAFDGQQRIARFTSA
ncbi:hypothetical protein D9M68_1003510 [compost metagenome]